MILITGGTGFIGSHLVRRFHGEGRNLRVLLRPSKVSPSLPPGLPVEVAISSLEDERGLRAAMVGVDAIYHLAGVNWLDTRLNWFETEVEGTRNLISAAQDAGVGRLIYMSHLDADRASAFPLIKAKAIVEEDIRQSGLDYTLLRSGLVFGAGDNFTVPLAKLISLSPAFFPFAGDGNALLQPLWIDDLIACLAWSLDHEACLNASIDIGGPEHLRIEDIVSTVAETIGRKRYYSEIRPSYFRILSNSLRFVFPRLPLSTVWVDYLANNHVTSLDGITKTFGLLPSRFSHKLQHLEGPSWGRQLISEMLCGART